VRYKKEWSIYFAIVAALILVAALLRVRSRGRYFPPRENLSSLPMQMGGWIGQDVSLDQPATDSLLPQDVLLRNYHNVNQPEPPVTLFIDYLPSENGAQLHSEEEDLPAGWVVTSRQTVQIARRDGSSFPANCAVVSKAGGRVLALYWYQAHGRAAASEYWARFYLVADSIRMNRTDGALVRLTTELNSGESPDAAQARMMNLGSQFLPLLDRFIPR
jgi:EpsI family protein